MKEYWSEKDGLFIKELTFQDWLTGEIIREHEDGEYEYETDPDGKSILEKNPDFKRPKISEYIGAEDCEYGWIEENLRSGKLTKFIVPDAEELGKIESYLEATYWRLANGFFYKERYAFSENWEGVKSELMVQHELDKLNYCFDPNSFVQPPILVVNMSRDERYRYDKFHEVYSDYMQRGRKTNECFGDILRTQHYQVDARLKYRSWLLNLKNDRFLTENELQSKSDSKEGQKLPSLKLTVRAAALLLKYEDYYFSDPRGDNNSEASFLAKRLCKNDSPNSGSNLRNYWNKVKITKGYLAKLIEERSHNPHSQVLAKHMKSLVAIIPHLTPNAKSLAMEHLEYLKNENESLN